MKRIAPEDRSPARRLLTAAAAMGLPLTTAMAGELVALLDRIALEPQNLTAIEDVAEGVDRHLADSLAGLVLAELRGSVCDIGSGAGLPGLVIAMMRPDTPVTLVESEVRKADWLVRASAALPSVSVVTDRSETLARRRREEFTTVTARAVAAPVPALELAAPLVAPGGHAVLWTTADDAAASEAALRLAAAELGFGAPRAVPVTPFPGARRRLLVARKERACPARYPRRPGRAAKRPIA